MGASGDQFNQICLSECFGFLWGVVKSTFTVPVKSRNDQSVLFLLLVLLVLVFAAIVSFVPSPF